ncbi:MAG: IS66 family insertion sequence element accessory protein TnpB [Myxococcota bacterium]|nr:IS66 family insertion sequence element accessory protein TnpB [Myxococcota bacterium]
MIPGHVRIFVCTEPVDMRKSFDTLALATQTLMGQDPMSGGLFVFVNKRFNRMKILWWDKTGYALLCKRLHRAVFRIPKAIEPGKAGVAISTQELAKIIEGIQLPQKKRRF